METFFDHKKKGISSRGYTCMKLFMKDKGFFHVIPMKSNIEVPLALIFLPKTSVLLMPSSVIPLENISLSLYVIFVIESEPLSVS